MVTLCLCFFALAQEQRFKRRKRKATNNKICFKGCAKHVPLLVSLILCAGKDKSLLKSKIRDTKSIQKPTRAAEYKQGLIVSFKSTKKI